MADKDKVTTVRRKSRLAAFKALRDQRGFPVPPRKAMSLADKTSKGLAYPLPPYAGQNLLLLFREVRGEWKALGKYKRLALPIIAIVALTTWERENELRQERWDQVEREETISLANKLYAKSLVQPETRKKGFRLSNLFNRGGKNKN